MTKSKSILTTVLCAVFLVAVFGIFTGCGQITTTKIEISDSTVQTVVKKGSDFSTDGIVVKAIRSDKSELTLDHDNLTFSTIDTSTFGTKTLTVKYTVDGNEFADSIDILVYGNLSSIEVKANTYNATAYQGFSYSPGNVVITATYEGGYTQEVSTGLSFGTIDTSTTGEKDLVVSYTVDGVTKTDTVTVTVKAETLSEIRISSYDEVVEKGSVYNIDDVVVEARFGEDTTFTRLDSDDYILSTIDTSTAGDQDLTATYVGNSAKTATVTVKVYGDLLGIAIKEGTIPTSISDRSEFTIDNLVIIASYEGNYQKELTAGFSTNINEFTAEVVNNFEFVVTFQGQTATADISLNKPYMVMGFEDPLTISAGYKLNSKKQNTFDDTYSTGTKGFEVTDRPYVVGTANPFIYSPRLKVMYAGSTTCLTIHDYALSAKVFVQNDGAYGDELAGSALEQYVTFDKDSHEFQFKAAAEGKTFKISTMPANITSAEASRISPSEFEFDVIDGYNIYNAADLSAIDNANIEGKWNKLKTENGIPTNVNTHSFILHNDIRIQDSDIPDVHFYKATDDDVVNAADKQYVVGSLKDTSSSVSPYGLIYKHVLGEGEDFRLEGNYFTISAQDLALIYRGNGEVRPSPDTPITIHTAFFGVYSNDDGVTIPQKYSEIEAKVTDGTYADIAAAEEALIETCEMNNLSLIGNSNKSEEAKKSGGVIFSKINGVKSKMDNHFTQSWAISYFTQGDVSVAYETEDIMSIADPEVNLRDLYGNTSYLDMTLDHVNAFDAYTSLIYNWGQTIHIRDSHLIGAGGPVMISDHAYNDENGNGGLVPHVTIDTNSVLQSYVMGTEGWFNAYPAAKILFGYLRAQESFFSHENAAEQNGVKKTLLKNEKINLVSAFKSGADEDATTSYIKATFDIEGEDLGLKMDGANTAQQMTELVVMGEMLKDSTQYGGATIAQMVAGIQAQAADNGETLSIMQAFKKLLAQSKDISDAFEAQVGASYDKVKVGADAGIVYYAPNGMICEPTDTSYEWVIKPNKDLYKEYESGYLYASIRSHIGAVISIDTITEPSA